jgi:general secretion pathway protein G
MQRRVSELTRGRLRRQSPDGNSLGFTLIELLVVVSIVGLLTAVITVNTNAARVQSRDTKRKADVALVAASLEQYYAERRIYPIVTSWPTSWDELKAALYPTYISLWPTDPTGTDGQFSSGFVYYANKTGDLANAPQGTLYMLDTPLEGREAETASSMDCDQGTPQFYLSGTKECLGRIHYRMSPR